MNSSNIPQVRKIYYHNGLLRALKYLVHACENEETIIARRNAVKQAKELLSNIEAEEKRYGRHGR